MLIETTTSSIAQPNSSVSSVSAKHAALRLSMTDAAHLQQLSPLTKQEEELSTAKIEKKKQELAQRELESRQRIAAEEQQLEKWRNNLDAQQRNNDSKLASLQKQLKESARLHAQNLLDQCNMKKEAQQIAKAYQELEVRRRAVENKEHQSSDTVREQEAITAVAQSLDEQKKALDLAQKEAAEKMAKIERQSVAQQEQQLLLDNERQAVQEKMEELAQKEQLIAEKSRVGDSSFASAVTNPSSGKKRRVVKETETINSSDLQLSTPETTINQYILDDSNKQSSMPQANHGLLSQQAASNSDEELEILFDGEPDIWNEALAGAAADNLDNSNM